MPDKLQRNDLIANEVEVWGKKMGFNPTEFTELINLLIKTTRYISLDMMEEVLSWEIDDFLKEKTKLEKLKRSRSGVFKK